MISIQDDARPWRFSSLLSSPPTQKVGKVKSHCLSVSLSPCPSIVFAWSMENKIREACSIDTITVQNSLGVLLNWISDGIISRALFAEVDFVSCGIVIDCGVKCEIIACSASLVGMTPLRKERAWEIKSLFDSTLQIKIIIMLRTTTTTSGRWTWKCILKRTRNCYVTQRKDKQMKLIRIVFIISVIYLGAPKVLHLIFPRVTIAIQCSCELL